MLVVCSTAKNFLPIGARLCNLDYQKSELAPIIFEVKVSADQDNLWKEVIDAFLEDFLSFFFPKIHQDIDWSRGYEFLDKELEQLNPDGESSYRIADKLAKVYFKDGVETWLLIHIEVQGYKDISFERRMFIYNYRIMDFYNQEEVISLSILTDNSIKYRPKEYLYQRGEFTRYMKFPTVKLLDYNKDWQALETNPNPFAIVVMAQLKALKTKKDDTKLIWKIKLMRMLYERGYNREQILKLFRFLDWIIRLPKDLELKFRKEVEKEDVRMPYVTSIERLAKEEGFLEGKQEGFLEIIFAQIEQKFGTLEPELTQQISTLSTEQLIELAKQMFSLSTKTDLVKWLQNTKS